MPYFAATRFKPDGKEEHYQGLECDICQKQISKPMVFNENIENWAKENGFICKGGQTICPDCAGNKTKRPKFEIPKEIPRAVTNELIKHGLREAPNILRHLSKLFR